MVKPSILLVFLLKLFAASLGQDATNIKEKFPTDCTTPNGGKGLCIEIQQCAKFIVQIEQNNTETFAFIKQSACGPLNEDPTRPKVCCGQDVNFKTAESSTYAPQHVVVPDNSVTTPLPEHLRDPLPQLCGMQRVIVNNRIFGGESAEIGEFPWMARLIHKNSYNYTSLGCSGFLIHRRFVLTAAHCLSNKNLQSIGKLHGVILGSHNSTNRPACVKTEREIICSDSPKYVEVLSVIMHKDYDQQQHVHDIALIHLKDKLSFTDYIKAICLPKTDLLLPEYTISGWGKTELDSGSSVKLKVTIPRVDREYCTRQYRTVGVNIVDNQLCAGGQYGKDSCAGDSGGPLMGFNVQDQKWYSYGIVSYGYGCGQDGWPGVYTNLPLYYNWIVDNIRKNK